MLIWAVFAVMAAVAVAAVLRPLFRGPAGVADRSEHAAAVYRDQLSEIDKDLDRGVLSTAEADSARAEVARRLLSADGAENSAPQDRPLGRRGAKTAALFVLIAVPVIAVGSYLGSGSPDLPAQPFAERQREPVGGQDLAALVARVEGHLQANPKDGKGWQVLGPAYMRLRRFRDAVHAFEQALALNGPSAEGAAALGEALYFAAGEVVEAKARRVFEQANRLNPQMVMPRYYLGLAALQEGADGKAIAMWQALIDDAPPGAPWVPGMAKQITDAGGTPRLPSGNQVTARAPALDSETVQAAQSMSAEDRQAMIESMVAGLDERLRDGGGTAEEWLRLVRAYLVLGDRDKAVAALGRARSGLESDADALDKLASGAKAMNLEFAEP